MSILEDKFYQMWEQLNPDLDLDREVLLIPKRKFRFDFTQSHTKVAIEINGGTWSKGGHSSGVGLERDYEKLNLAQAQGWLVFQLSSSMITPDWIASIGETCRHRYGVQNSN